MADDKKKTRPLDALKVNVNQEYEVNWWCDQFGCSESQLKAAVKAVGVMAADVKRHLGK